MHNTVAVVHTSKDPAVALDMEPQELHVDHLLMADCAEPFLVMVDMNIAIDLDMVVVGVDQLFDQEVVQEVEDACKLCGKHFGLVPWLSYFL